MPKGWKYTDITRKVDSILQELGESLPRIISILFRAGMLYLFLWYLCAFSYELWANQKLLLVFVWIVVVPLLAWRFVNACYDSDTNREPASSSLFAFVCLNLLPIAVVALATWYGYIFVNNPLLVFTQSFLKRILG